MDAKFLRNQRFSKKHNLSTALQLKRAAARKQAREVKKSGVKETGTKKV